MQKMRLGTLQVSLGSLMRNNFTCETRILNVSQGTQLDQVLYNENASNSIEKRKKSLAPFLL